MTEAPAPRPLPSLGVLVADPTPHMADLVVGMLRTLGIRDIREAGEAAAIMSELKRRPFDALVLDDSLKGIGSIEFTRRLRACADCPNRHIPIIMMSGLPDVARIRQARDSGVTEFLRKPFSVQHLEARLKTIVNAPRAFIATDAYAGPDRRRRAADYTGSDRRGGGAAT